MATPPTWLLATAVTLAPPSGTGVPEHIDVDCATELALEHAPEKAARVGAVEIHLHGVCKGHFVINTDGVTLLGATGESGLAAPLGDPGFTPLLEIVDAQANLRRMIVEGGGGVLARGWDAEVLLFEVDVHDQVFNGVTASRGARVRVLDSSINHGSTGVEAQSDSEVVLQRVTIDHQRVGVFVTNESRAVLEDTTIVDNSEVGLNVGDRSDVTVFDGVFRENGGAHINASDWSSVRLLLRATIGSETDKTPFALSVNRGATVASYSTPVLYGDVSALIGGSIQLGETVLHGDLSVLQFSNAFVRNATINGKVICADGSDAICRQTTTAGAFDCPSPTCGSAPAAAGGGAPAIPELPVIEAPDRERPRSRR